MPDCEIIQSEKVSLVNSYNWNLRLDFFGIETPFKVIDLKEKIIAGAEISRCKNYGEYKDAIVVVFELKDRNSE